MDTRQLNPPLLPITIRAALDAILSLNLNIKLNRFPQPFTIRLPAPVHRAQEYDEPSGDGGAEDAQSQRTVHYRVVQNLLLDQDGNVGEDGEGGEGDELGVREEEEAAGCDDGDKEEDVDGGGVGAFADGEAGAGGGGW